MHCSLFSEAHCYRLERQKLVRQVKITLPALIRQKRLVWNLALHWEFFSTRITKRRHRVLCPSAKINVWGTRRHRSRDLSGTANRRLPRHDSVSAQDKLLKLCSFKKYQQSSFKHVRRHFAGTICNTGEPSLSVFVHFCPVAIFVTQPFVHDRTNFVIRLVFHLIFLNGTFLYFCHHSLTPFVHVCLSCVWTGFHLFFCTCTFVLLWLLKSTFVTPL